MLGFDDISKIFEEIELRLIRSLKRNIGRHKQEEQQEGFKWSAWQAEKLRNVNKFRRECSVIMSEYTDVIDSETRQLMEEQFKEGMKTSDVEPQFFGVDNTKVTKLIDDVVNLENHAETAALRTMDDVYRQTVNKAQLAMSTGSVTLQQAIDMAVRDFLDKGINCIVYRDGRRVNIADYVRMALRTTSTRAKLQGEAAKIKALGYDTVQVSKYSMCSDTCLPWQGRPYIDDVFSFWDGEIKEQENGELWGKSNYCGKWFPLLSTAIYSGLFHPNCRHTISLYVDGDPLPKAIDNSEIEKRYNLEQKQRRLENEVRRAKRKVEGFSAPDNVKKANKELHEAHKKLCDFIDKVNAEEGKIILKRDYGREKIYSGDSVDFSTESGIIESYKGNSIPIIESNEVSSETTEKIRRATEIVTNDFPVLNDHIENISFGDADGAAAINSFTPLTGVNRITFSERVFSDSARLQESLANDFASGWSYETNYIESLVAHEMGHAAHISLALKRAEIKCRKPLSSIECHIFEQEYNKITQEVYIVSFTTESYDEIQALCVNQLGRMVYANSHELIAQSFGNYYYGTSKSKIAKAIVEFFKKELR